METVEPEVTEAREVTASPEDDPSDDIAQISIEDNQSDQDYSVASGSLESYLVPVDGGYMAVGPTEDGTRVLVKYYDSSYQRTSYRYVDRELSIFGGFYAGTDAYYLAFGQNNVEEDDSKEVIRVVKYDKDWNRLKAASLCGANTIHPFDAGSLRMDGGRRDLHQ